MAKRSKSKPTTPATPITLVESNILQTAFNHFNRVLFDGQLPHVLLMLQRKANSAGYYAANRFSYRADGTKEHVVALNPDGFIEQPDVDACQTLVHEMVHVWQHFFGQPSKRGYHNREWAAKMIEVGLMPSSTGMEGGKITGQRMSNYVLSEGRFKPAFADLAATGWKLNLDSAAYSGAVKQPESKVKFTCPGCGSNMWGKPESQDICGDCKQWRVTEAVGSYDARPAAQ